MATLSGDAYLSADPAHEGLLLHAVYHRPNGWDHVPSGRKVPCGESCLWGDYHLLELALLIRREAQAQGKSVAAHYAHLVVHGVLHLRGYAHEKKRDAARMEAREIRILRRIGITNPYAVE